MSVKTERLDSFSSIYVDDIVHRQKAANRAAEMAQGELEMASLMQNTLLNMLRGKFGTDKLQIDWQAKTITYEIADEAPANGGG